MLVTGSTLTPCYRGSNLILLRVIIAFILSLGVIHYIFIMNWFEGESTEVLPKTFGIRQIAEAQRKDEYKMRLKKYQDVCSVSKKSVRSNNQILYYHNPRTNTSLSWCAVPKVGATFWARIFQFLNRTSRSRSVASPLDITRFEVYYHPLIELQKMSYNLDRMADALRFFFVRDPYARLMSAYVDKFLLPQFLGWTSYRKIVARLGNNFLVTHSTCLTKKIAFKEFIEGIVFSGDRNYHWKPIYTICDPCKFFPHVIGKQETFASDVKYILTQVGLGHLMTKYSHKTYIGDEIKQMVDFTYAFRDFNQYLRKCFDNIAIAERLWQAFQMNGYIATGREFPKSTIEILLSKTGNTKNVTNILTKVMVRENARAELSHDQHSKQKRDMLVREFATLSKDNMEKLADMYDVDFRMFGYEKYPRDLFPWRYVKNVDTDN